MKILGVYFSKNKLEGEKAKFKISSRFLICGDKEC
jgi:hypothetical protein